MTDSYCSRDDVATAAAVIDPDEVMEDRLNMAALLGTAYVNIYVSGTVGADLTPPYEVEPVACPAPYRAAAIIAAVRYLNSKDVPFGVVNVGDYGRVIGSIPEADLLLRGFKADWGLS